jgi:hypothetical protein
MDPTILRIITEKIIAQNPEISEQLKKGSPQKPGLDESKPPAYDESLEYQAGRPDDMFSVAPAVVTPVEYEGVTYNFGDPLQAIVNRPLPEAPTNYPISPPAMPTPMPTPVNPFQRREAPLAPTPQLVNQYSPPPVMQTWLSMTPITDFSFYQAPQQEIALTPAEVLAQAKNPFNRPT